MAQQRELPVHHGEDLAAALEWPKGISAAQVYPADAAAADVVSLGALNDELPEHDLAVDQELADLREAGEARL